MSMIKRSAATYRSLRKPINTGDSKLPMAPAAVLYPTNPLENMWVPRSPVLTAMYEPKVTPQVPRGQNCRNIIAERRARSEPDEQFGGVAPAALESSMDVEIGAARSRNRYRLSCSKAFDAADWDAGQCD
jgi:hypothetical protein